MKNGRPNPVFRALADPTRRALFEELSRRGELTVHALTRLAGVSQPAVSRHLAVLKRAHLVHPRCQGRETHYHANSASLEPLANWLRDYSVFWKARFDRLESLLEKMQP
ncbi:MAG: metalloregulator ArsR/SmtB family transcription factor [Acidobacteriaceae bacterium]